MTTVYFSKTVKYNGTVYPAQTRFKASLDDLETLKTQGAFIVEGKASGGLLGAKPEQLARAVEASPKFDELKAKAEKLGIKVKGTWGEKRILAELAKHK